MLLGVENKLMVRFLDGRQLLLNHNRLPCIRPTEIILFDGYNFVFGIQLAIAAPIFFIILIPHSAIEVLNLSGAQYFLYILYIYDFRFYRVTFRIIWENDIIACNTPLHIAQDWHPAIIVFFIFANSFLWDLVLITPFMFFQIQNSFSGVSFRRSRICPFVFSVIIIGVDTLI